MSTGIPAHQLGEAVVDAVRDNTYPDSEDIVSAEFPPAAFSQALELFDHARDEVKARVCASSKDSAQDIDGWISQAKQLRRDIESAQRSSEDILAKAQRNEELQQSVHDARSKLRLLEEEVVFNQDLAAALEQIQQIRLVTGQVQGLLDRSEWFKAVGLLLKSENELGSLQSGRNIKAVAILQLESRELRQRIARTLTQKWHDAIRIDAQAFTISLPYDVERLAAIATAIQDMDLIENLIADCAGKLQSAIIMPRILQVNMCDRSLITDNETMALSEACSSSDMHRLFSDIGTIIGFLQTHLPSSIIESLSKVCGPNLVESLISERLSSAVPQDLAALQDFDSTREQIYRFSETLHSCGWPGADQLRAWTNSVPQVWLEKRQRLSLDEVRQLLKRGLGGVRTVERVETQTVPQEDRLFRGNTSSEDWNAEWSDEEGRSPIGDEVIQHGDAGGDEDDVSAWGLDDERDRESKSQEAAPSASDDDEADAWGWGDDHDDESGSKSSQQKLAKSANQGVNGHVTLHPRSEREVTLRETYNITSLPTGILDLMRGIISDVDTLGKLTSGNSSMASAVPGLSGLPSLLLVMYRASASNLYTFNNSGNMFLYNDCLWLGDQLRQIMQARAQHAGDPSAKDECPIQFDNDIAALGTFGKRSYGKEMESQRTIIKDFLDGAQGFANCTEPPFAQECDLAVSSIVDRLRDIHEQWKDVLSHSALLQSVGSLLSTVIDKMIIDIEDMSDISEPESQRLTAYCKQVIALEDLFLPQAQATPTSGDSKEALPLTAVYVPGWFKFQYLSEILDSSLVDIKYLWTDGGLKLEYETEEVVELIEALFADSEHRRRAIGEIRRS